MDPYQEKYKRHRARIIAQIKQQWAEDRAPLVKGGQGRTERELLDGAGWLLALALLVVVLLILSACMGGRR